jgi:predicted MFS family arabinose efflux permease
MSQVPALPELVPAAAASPAFSRRTRRYILAILTTVYISNYVDRQILAILLEPIKHTFDLSDTQLGFLSGISFAIFYATLGIPIAMWADRGNRRNIITLATTVFSVMTALCGLAASFAQLALARLGGGIGEAGSSPPSRSILADLYPPQERATAMAIFALGVNVGILIGFLAGGWMNEFFGWRAAFMVVGIPGLLLALLVRLTVPEPERGSSEGRDHEADATAPPLRDAFALFWRRRSLRHIAIGATLNSFVGYGAVAWVPAFLIRSFGMSTGDIGTALALIIGIVGGTGTFLGGYFADRLARRDVRWNVWLVAACIGGGFPFAFAVYLAPTAFWALLSFLIPAAVGALYLGPSLAMVQGLVPLRMRTVASAVLLFIINIIGLGFGPQMVGVVSDLLAPRFGQESLRYALLCVGCVNLWAAFHFYRAARTLGEDLALANAGAE